VRIIIAGPPKAGNVWLKCLLGHIYDLRPLTKQETPQRPQFHLLKAWLEGGNFPDGTIFHQHYDYRDELAIHTTDVSPPISQSSSIKTMVYVAAAAQT
jgi:hypothetical protein